MSARIGPFPQWMIDNLGVTEEVICAAVNSPATWAFDVISATNADVSVAGGTINFSQVDQTLEASAEFLAIIFGGEDAFFQIRSAWSRAEPPAIPAFASIVVQRSPTQFEDISGNQTYTTGGAVTTVPTNACCPYAVIISYSASPETSEEDTPANGTVTMTFEEVV